MDPRPRRRSSSVADVYVSFPFSIHFCDREPRPRQMYIYFLPAFYLFLVSSPTLGQRRNSFKAPELLAQTLCSRVQVHATAAAFQAPFRYGHSSDFEPRSSQFFYQCYAPRHGYSFFPDSCDRHGHFFLFIFFNGRVSTHFDRAPRGEGASVKLVIEEGKGLEERRRARCRN